MREVRHHLIRIAAEFRAQLRTLRRNAGRARIEVTLTRHIAAHRDQRSGAETVRLRAEHRRDHDIASGTKSTVDAHFDAMTQSIAHQHMLRFGQSEFPWCTGVLDA